MMMSLGAYAPSGARAAQKPLKVFILAGQSNMEGHAWTGTFNSLAGDPVTAPILKEMRNADGTPRVCEKVWISYSFGNSQGEPGGEMHGKLTTGFGANPPNNVNYPLIGPEFTFGIYMQKMLDEPILLIKTAWGGRSLHTAFRPPSAGPYELNQYQLDLYKKQGKDIEKNKAENVKASGRSYRLMTEHVRKVLADIKQVYPDYDPKQGYELAGFVWFQGWNDLCDSDAYPDRDKPGGYDLYSKLLAQLIRDVRKDLSAPKLPFVIGVMGVGGVLDKKTPNQDTASHRNFRMAMAAPANLPEFKGNVVNVLTEKYWDDKLDELASRWEKVEARSAALNKDKSLTREQRTAALEKYKAELFTPEELKMKEEGISNWYCHYLGAAKILAQIGKGFAEAMVEVMKQQKAELAPEAADPDIYDMSVWKNIKPGLHSGFGSIDVAYSKSIPPAGDIAESIKLHGWKGERVNCQLLVWSAGSEENISIKASGFSSGHYEIDKERASISVVKYVLTDEFPGGNDRRDKGKILAHLKPDLLSKTNRFTIDTPGTRPVWISVDIPPETPAGIYEGTISRQSASGTVNHIITLEVQNKVLPAASEWSFHLDLWQNPYAVARFHGVKLWSQEHVNLLRPLLTMLAQAGQKCITTTLIDKPWGEQVFDSHGSMINWIKKSDGTWRYDYSVFDRYVSLAMETGIKEQINCYSMVPVGNKFSWFDEKSGKSITVEAIPGTAEYENIWRDFLNDFKVHLREKGWLDKTSIALDEREEEEMEKMFSFLKETAPELKISMAGFYYEKINPSIYDFSSNWRHIDKISGGIVESRRRSGLKTTYYVACGIPKPNTFTFSPPSESCYEGWFASAMGLDGFLRWAYNSWVENPEFDSRFITWPSGDTALVYPGARSSIRFERLREGIQDYEKIRILREELARNPSAEAAAAKAKLNEFMSSMNTKTLDNKSAADVINQGKQLLSEIVKSLYQDKPAAAAGRSQDSGLKLMGNRFLTFSTIVRVNQIETSREGTDGDDESSIHGPEEARVFRDAVEKGWPGARITWAFSWLALKDQRPNYLELKKLVVSYHEKYGDEITFVPGGYFANMYNSRGQVNRDLHDGLQMVSEMVGGRYRPQSVIAGFLSAENLRFLAEEEGIHVCQGNIWSQYAVDNGDGEGSISYPYYPSREHFCKPAQGKEDLIDCVNLDGWTVDFLCARYPRARMINGVRCGSRQGVGPIETLLRMGTEQGTRGMLATTAAHFDTGFALNNFAWVTCIWELCLVEGRKVYGYDGRNGLDGLVIWLSEMRRRWPEAKCITQGEFGMLWREQFKNNDHLNYRFVQRGSGIGGSDPDMEIRWFMNKDFRLALLRNWQDNTPENLIDFTRYDLKAREPSDPTPGQHSRNWSLLNRLNQKGVRPQDKPISIGQLNVDEQAVIKRRCPELIKDDEGK